MAKMILILCLALGLVGCASHYSKSTFKTPTQEGSEECDEKVNGSTSCVRNFEVKRGGYGGYGYGGGYMPYGGAMHPPVLFVDQPETTAGQRAMERIGGGVLVLHPAVQTEPCVDEGCPTLVEDVKRVSDLAVATDQDVESLKEDVKSLKKNSKEEEEK